MKTVSRDEAIEIIKKVRQLVDISSEIQMLLNDTSANNEGDGTDVICQGVSNGFIAEIIQIVSGHSVEVAGNAEDLYRCPCCGYKTLTEKYDPVEGTGYDICPYCRWEDDGTLKSNSYSSVNRGTMADYQRTMKLNQNKYYIDKWYK